MGSSIGEAITLLASAAQTATSSGETAVNVQDVRPRKPVGWLFCLDVTAAATDAGDLLDVYVQTQIGDNWVDILRFTQVLGNGGAKRFFESIVVEDDEAFDNASAIAAGDARSLFGPNFRVRFAITDAGTDNASFTFSVTATPQ